jgi:hypothetical protein
MTSKLKLVAIQPLIVLVALLITSAVGLWLAHSDFITD